jgi:hypothetical protein
MMFSKQGKISTHFGTTCGDQLVEHADIPLGQKPGIVSPRQLASSV